MITIIIGLGNPGKEFAHTRHNSGFLALDALAASLTKDTEASWHTDKKVYAELLEVKRNKDTLILVKPQTMMNASGKAAAALAKKYKTKSARIVVIHDDIDIPLGKFKISFGKHSAGHKGVESIIRALKTKDFWRLRIGIHPKTKKKVDAMKLILAKFTPGEQRILAGVLKDAVAALEALKN